MFDQGSQLLLDQKFDPAIDVFSRGAARYSRSMKLQIGLGVALYARARYEAALKAFCTASDLSPTDPRPYFFLAKLGDSAAKNSPEVTKRLERYVTLQPQSSSATYYNAICLWSTQRDKGQVNFEQIEPMLRKAIALNPALPDAHLALGNLYFEARNYPQAIQEFHQAVKLQPNLAEPHYRLAQAYSHTGEDTLARQELEVHERLRKDPKAESALRRVEIERLIDSAEGAPSH